MLNNITIMGRLTQDPEPHVSGRSGNAFTTFSIANDRDYDRETTDFYDCMAFGKTGDFIQNYFEKGRMILVKGHLQTSKWTDSNGKNRKDVKIIADNVYFCDSAKIYGNSRPTQENTTFAPAVNANDFTDVDDKELPF